MRLTADFGDLRKVVASVYVDGEAAATAAVQVAGRATQQELRGQVIGTLGGNARGIANAWRVRTFPTQPSLGAAALVWSRAPDIVEAFDRGVTIRAKGGGWLAIPTPAAQRLRGAGGTRGGRVTPAAFERATGSKLDLVYTQRNVALLITRGRFGGGGRRFQGSFRATDRQLRNWNRRREERFLVAFVLVPIVRLNKRLDLAGAAQRGLERLAGALVSNWRDTPNNGRQA